MPARLLSNRFFALAAAALLAIAGAAIMEQARANGSPAANRELGQIDMAHNGANLIDGIGLNSPAGVAIDAITKPARLYLADGLNNRVLVWKNAAGFASGASADFVIGQTNLFGSDGSGCGVTPSASTLCQPAGVAVDKAGNLYVADSVNNRVLEYFAPVGNDAAAGLVFGQSGSFRSRIANNGGLSADSLWLPLGVAVDPANNLYVADFRNNRVLEYNRSLGKATTTASTVFGQFGVFTSNTCNNGGAISADSLCGPAAVAVDSANDVYIADFKNNRVLEYDLPLVNGTTAHVVFGQFGSSDSAVCNLAGASPDSLCGPAGVAVDSSRRLYIMDANNNRVLGYVSPALGGTTSTLVLGQSNSFNFTDCNHAGLNADSLCTAGGPSIHNGLAVDAANNIYVADQLNSRSLVYADPFNNGAAAGRQSGQIDFAHNTTNLTDLRGLSPAFGIAIDRHVTPNRLYVSDRLNSRVLGWNDADSFANGEPADLLIGQPDFYSSACNSGGLSASSLCLPASLAVDGNGNLYVADRVNNRVLEFDQPFAGVRPAHLIFGQASDPTTGQCDKGGVSADSLCFEKSGFRNVPITGLAIDASGNLYVADTLNNRVLEYDTPLTNGTSATHVLGPSSFTSGVCPHGQVPCLPSGVVSGPSGILYVADAAHSQIVEYDQPLTPGAMPARIYGYSGFTGLYFPAGLAVDGGGNLYVADSGSSRVLLYTDPQVYVNPAAVFGQPSFSTFDCNHGGLGAASLCGPLAVAVDSLNNLYIADSQNSRVLEYKAPLAPAIPAATASPAILAFPYQAVGTRSAPGNVMLFNNKFQSIAISRIVTSGDFGQTNTCPPTLGPTGCKIKVVFSPRTAGPITGTLSITDSARNSPQTVNLSGTGIGPVMLWPHQVSFASQKVGTSASRNVFLINSQSVALNISAIGIAGSNLSDFSQTNQCGKKLMPNSNCKIIVTFSPKAAGSRQATLSAHDDGIGSPQSASLSGTGTTTTTRKPTATRSPRPTRSPTRTPIRTHTRTPRPTRTPVRTPARTPTHTRSRTRTPTSTRTP